MCVLFTAASAGINHVWWFWSATGVESIDYRRKVLVLKMDRGNFLVLRSNFA